MSKIAAIAFSISLLVSCNHSQKNDLSTERNKIVALHNLQRTYHFTRDSINFVNQLSDHFISVNKGVISSPSRSETLTRYNKYFTSVEFIKWNDLSEPIIKFSDDGTLAYTIVDKEVVLTYKDEEGKSIEEKTHFAWTTIYKKYGDEWKIDCVTSTNEPGIVSSVNN